MTANACSCGSPLRALLLLAVLGGMLAVASSGCSAKPVCERDLDCGPGYLCIDQERCVEDPRGARRDGGSGTDGGGVDATPGPDSSVQPSSCNSDTDVFEPGEVYLLGSLSGVDCTPSAMAALKAPDLESVGFSCGIDEQNAVLRSDGRLVYLDTMAKKVLVFTRDDHPYDTGLGACSYPADPAANDIEVSTTSCDNSGGPAGFLIAPDFEGVWYTCANAPGLWFDENDVQLGFLGGSTPLLRGYGGSVLAAQGTSGTATASTLELYASGGSEIALGDLPQEGNVLAVRALDDGFRVAVQGDGEASGQLVIIGLDGSATSGGAYPALPTGVTVDATGAGKVMDAAGALYVAAIDDRDGQAHHVVVKLAPAPDGTATVVYTEADAPEVGTVSAVLVTGL